MDALAPIDAVDPSVGDVHRKQKMEAITTLAGGIAHEFNNALAGLVGNIELLKFKLEQEDHLHRYTDNMMSSVERMQRNTNQLLAFAQCSELYTTRINIRLLIRKTIVSTQSQIPPNISTLVDVTPNISDVRADVRQIKIMLSAVINNAAEAMQGGGRILVSAKDIQVEKGATPPYGNLSPGSYLLLSVKDNGSGMDQNTLIRACDPFFTTHMFGRGLGLSTAYGIAEKHAGKIELTSTLGQGTEVRIYLPSICSTDGTP